MHDDEPIGIVDLFKRSEDSALEIGYSMVPDYWGLGFMYEACEAVIEEAKRTLGATRGFTAARTHEEWFSMGRMEKAKGVTLTLELDRSPSWQEEDGLNSPPRHREPAKLFIRAKLSVKMAAPDFERGCYESVP